MVESPVQKANVDYTHDPKDLHVLYRKIYSYSFHDKSAWTLELKTYKSLEA